MLHLLQSIDFEKILKTGVAIVLVSSLFFLFLNMGKKENKPEYPFDEKDLYQ